MVVKKLEELDQFNLSTHSIRNFNVLINLNNPIVRTRKAERKYVTKPVNLIMTQERKFPVFLSRRLRLKANETAIVSLRMSHFIELSDN